MKINVDFQLGKPYITGMQLKASNPYSESETPVSWYGWETGFNSKPNTNVSQSEIATYGLTFEKAFYRGQGAQITRKYAMTYKGHTIEVKQTYWPDPHINFFYGYIDGAIAMNKYGQPFSWRTAEQAEPFLVSLINSREAAMAQGLEERIQQLEETL
jgi:hypothetical protein